MVISVIINDQKPVALCPDPNLNNLNQGSFYTVNMIDLIKIENIINRRQFT